MTYLILCKELHNSRWPTASISVPLGLTFGGSVKLFAALVDIMACKKLYEALTITRDLYKTNPP
jgi:hypothetical protein